MDLMPCPFCGSLVADQDWGVCPKCGGQYEGSRFAAKEEADAQRAIQMKRERLAKKAAEEAERLKAKAEWENKTFFQKAPLRLFYGFCWLLFILALLGMWETCSKLWN